jgi:3,4-dihydroxy 2-butanone 4-phosphate synthase/GTP cyclohydrolase II
VIAEIVNDDGSMARLPELRAFADAHGLALVSIADLIAWRRRHDRFLERRIEADFDSAYGGRFRVVVFRNTLDGAEHVAVVKGRISAETPTLVRVHRVDFLADFLGEAGGREGLVRRAMERLAKAEEPGVAVFVRMGMGEEIARTLGALEANPKAADPPHPLREYGVGAQILKDLGVRRMIVMSNTKPNQLPGLDGYGLTVEGWRRIDGE